MMNLIINLKVLRAYFRYCAFHLYYTITFAITYVMCGNLIFLLTNDTLCLDSDSFIKGIQRKRDGNMRCWKSHCVRIKADKFSMCGFKGS